METNNQKNKEQPKNPSMDDGIDAKYKLLKEWEEAGNQMRELPLLVKQLLGNPLIQMLRNPKRAKLSSMNGDRLKITELDKGAVLIEFESKEKAPIFYDSLP